MKYLFNEPPNTASITCCHIIDGTSDILYVSHDEDDGMWQFLCGKSHNVSDARMISLYEICMLDTSIVELYELPCGYIAERDSKESNWTIRKK